ncbi:MAG TPA: Do family serine endopeptidase [Cyclobacteriaceae bacterium]|nr:Do family serine endopeptidase [Cyclobacteriaceae bacterium]
MKNLIKLIGAGLLGGLLALGVWNIAGLDSVRPGFENKPNYKIVQANYTKGDAVGGLNYDFSNVAEKATPSVVHIMSTLKESSAQVFEIPDPFKDFFGDQFLQPNQKVEPQPRVGSGSGVIIRPDGYIVTNNHVVDGASRIDVTLNDNRTLSAEVVGTDPNTDLALIKVDAKDLPTIIVGNSDNLRVGEWVLAIGNPFNLESTVTAGIVSAKGRNINILEDKAAIESFIQTDAAINPGNSGGALVDINGNLIGINTAIATPTGVYAGYGFAVPSNIMKKVVEDLINYGKVQRGFLGVTIRNLDSKLVKEKNLSINEGVYVDSLMDGGAAKDAGIKAGDVIIKLDNNDIKTSAQLQEGIARHNPGDKVDLTVVRKGSEKVIPVNLKNVTGDRSLVKAYQDEVLKGLGAEFENLSQKDKAKLGLTNQGGVVVAHLFPGKLTEQTDIQEGFIITSVNNKKINDVDGLIAELKRSGEGVLIQGIYPQRPDKKVYYGFSQAS